MTRRTIVAAAACVLFACAPRKTETKQAAAPPSSPAAPAERGAVLYAKTCAVCHGARAQGLAADRAPAIGGPDYLAIADDRFLRSAIADGRDGTTMSAWAARRGGPLSGADVDAVIAYLRTLGGEAKRPLDERPLQGHPMLGRKAYAARCQQCHGDRGRGGPDAAIGGVNFLQDAGNGFLRATIRGGRPGTTMPAFAGTLSDDDIDDVIALMRRWQADAGPGVPRDRQEPIPLPAEALSPRGPEPQGFQAVPAMTPADVVKAQRDAGARFVVLDARAPSDYIAEHIAGALSVPFYDSARYSAALPKDVWLVCYCACPHAESGQLAQALVGAGFPKVAVLDEGLPYWKSRGYATRTGRSP